MKRFNGKMSSTIFTKNLHHKIWQGPRCTIAEVFCRIAFSWENKFCCKTFLTTRLENSVNHKSRIVLKKVFTTGVFLEVSRYLQNSYSAGYLWVTVLIYRQWRRSGVFIVNFEHISHLVNM